MVNIGNDWDSILKGEFEKEYYQNMRKFLVKEYKQKLYILNRKKYFQHLSLQAIRTVK